MASGMIEDALRLYRRESLGIRLFVRARHLLAPLERIAAAVPRQGEILDVGCGHGLFACLLALQSPERRVLGVDPAPAKIAVAQRVASQLPNARFQLGTADDVDGGPFAAITILDVLYLLPLEEKRRVLRRCRELIAPDGLLVLKTNDTHPGWKYGATRLQERLMTGLGLTYGRNGLHFLSCDEHRALLGQCGFRAEVEHLPSRLPYPHTSFLARPA